MASASLATRVCTTTKHGQLLTLWFILLGWSWFANIHLIFLLPLLLGQVRVGVMITETRPVLIALPTDYTHTHTDIKMTVIRTLSGHIHQNIICSSAHDWSMTASHQKLSLMHAPLSCPHASFLCTVERSFHHSWLSWSSLILILQHHSKC